MFSRSSPHRTLRLSAGVRRPEFRVCLGVLLDCFLFISSAATASPTRPAALPGGFRAVTPEAVEPARYLSTKPPQSPVVAERHFLDPGNPQHAFLQAPADAYASLPKDRQGYPDWVSALANGSINPRADLHGQGGPQRLDLDILMTRTRGMPHVRFSHRLHTEWLACANCHPALFEARTGASRIRMADIFRGKACGTCHGKVAFAPSRDCNRCHNAPQARGAMSGVRP